MTSSEEDDHITAHLNRISLIKGDGFIDTDTALKLCRKYHLGECACLIEDFMRQSTPPKRVANGQILQYARKRRDGEAEVFVSLGESGHVTVLKHLGLVSLGDLLDLVGIQDGDRESEEIVRDLKRENVLWPVTEYKSPDLG